MRLKLTHLMMAGALCVTTTAFATDDPKPKKFIDPSNMDQSVKPGDDFFEYANGGWIKRNTIPAKQSAFGSFHVLIQDNTDKLLALLKEVSEAKGAAKGSLKQRVGDLYASGMDSVAIDKRGYDPIKPSLARVDKVTDLQGVINEITYQRMHGESGGLFSFGVGRDSKNPSKYIVSVGQGGTTLPDRDYYLKDDAISKRIRDAYRKYIVGMFTLIGTDATTAAANAETIIKMETELAKAQMTRVEMRDPNKTYNKLAVTDLSKSTPNLKWPQIFTTLKVPGQDSILTTSPSFLKAADALYAATPINDWKVYLKWNILKSRGGSLSTPFVDTRFAFNSVLTGQKVQTPRNERMSNLVDGSLGELLGQLYVEKYFTPAAKARMLELVNNLKVTLGDRIKGLDWMSDATKAKALRKLNAFTVKIGYTDKWETYKGLVIDRNDYSGNLQRIAEWGFNENVGLLGKPVDKTKWGMTPPTVNAYYNSLSNEIVFPAGILQFPFFSQGADDAFNYGAIGAVIGHEMTHGFDDKGRLYDADGTLRDWWTKEDNDKFTVRAERVAKQYDALTVLDTLHVNGHLTLGENLADLGGINVAYQAFKKTKQGQSNVKIDGFTPDQRFFLAYAQVWRGMQRPEYAAQLIKTDPHSPGMHRVNAPLTNIDAWYKAFDIKAGDKLYVKPEDRIRVW